MAAIRFASGAGSRFQRRKLMSRNCQALQLEHEQALKASSGAFGIWHALSCCRRSRIILRRQEEKTLREHALEDRNVSLLAGRSGAQNPSAPLLRTPVLRILHPSWGLEAHFGVPVSYQVGGELRSVLAEACLGVASSCARSVPMRSVGCRGSNYGM